MRECKKVALQLLFNILKVIHSRLHAAVELIKQLHFSGLVGLVKALPHFYDIRKFIRSGALSECTLYRYYRFNKSFLYIHTYILETKNTKMYIIYTVAYSAHCTCIFGGTV